MGFHFLTDVRNASQAHTVAELVVGDYIDTLSFTVTGHSEKEISITIYC